MIYSTDAPTEYCTAHVAGTSFTVCVDSAIQYENGEWSSYYLAGSYCPASSTRTYTYLSLDRVQIGSSYASDAAYQYSSQGSRGTCTVHGPNFDSGTDSEGNALPDGWLDPDNPFGDLFPTVPSEPSESIPGVTTPEPETPSDPVVPSEPSEPSNPFFPESDSNQDIPGVG